MRRGIITVGLGFGDEAKGATVDFLCRQLKADLVVRYSGGSQCGHNVQLPDGFTHTFSQFGAGTLAGVDTYLGEQVIINLPALHKEAEHLQQKLPVRPLSYLTFHPKCLVSTVYHQMLNQVKSAGKFDTCGHGIGETRSYWLKHGMDAIFAEDLKNKSTLKHKMELLRQRSYTELGSAINSISSRHEAHRLWDLGSDLALDEHVPMVDTVIFEGSQGVLLDEWYGFHPYTTWSTVTPYHALEMVEDQLGLEDVKVLGVTRTYATRHGKGPLPTYSEQLTEKFRDPNNPTNEWQGDLRCGYLDLPLLKYAADICKDSCGRGVDGLVVNHLDQVDRNTMVYDGGWWWPPPSPNLKLSDRMAVSLMLVSKLSIIGVDVQELKDLLSQIAPIMIEGSGPTHKDRALTDKFK